MRNITVAVPDEVYQMARVYAARKQTSVSAMVADFLFTIRHLARADQSVSPGAAIDHHREQLVQNHGYVNFEAVGVRKLCAITRELMKDL
jgi:hypothetical protein